MWWKNVKFFNLKRGIKIGVWIMFLWVWGCVDFDKWVSLELGGKMLYWKSFIVNVIFIIK